MSKSKKKLKIIPLGGVQEIGKNMTIFEYGEDIIIIDCGLAFPEEDMLGIDLVIPDMSYVIKNREKVKGIILTHGHEDHIGAMPYLLKELNIPVFGTKLTLGLLENKLEEHGLLTSAILVNVKQGETVELGVFEIEFIRSTHSIADTVALAIHTPVGVVVHTSDFKIDYTPIEGEPLDFARLAELGRDGVLLLLCDSTNVERKGYTMSERTVGETFEELFANSTGRVLVASFASNVHRIQQVINAAVKFGRRVAVCGRSMLNVVKVATELGYLNIPDGTIIDIDEIDNLPHKKLIILTTGSQGEPMSALSRMAASEHRKVEITPGDLVVISANPIPGNEKLVYRVINELFKKGADVIYDDLAEIHVSGHACQEELKIVHSLIKPMFFAPLHGEYRHLKQHVNLAHKLGMPKENTFILDTGNVLELTKDSAKIGNNVPSGRLLIDGYGVGDVGNVVLRDRKLLSQDGLIVIVISIEKESGCIVAGPDIISRGFVYVKESENLMEEVRLQIRNTLAKCEEKRKSDWVNKRNMIKENLKDYLYEKTRRKPMILPIVMEI